MKIRVKLHTFSIELIMREDEAKEIFTYLEQAGGCIDWSDTPSSVTEFKAQLGALIEGEKE